MMSKRNSAKNEPGIKGPDNGVICYVLKTGFNTQQGSLLRTIMVKRNNSIFRKYKRISKKKIVRREACQRKQFGNILLHSLPSYIRSCCVGLSVDQRYLFIFGSNVLNKKKTFVNFCKVPKTSRVPATNCCWSAC